MTIVLRAEHAQRKCSSCCCSLSVCWRKCLFTQFARDIRVYHTRTGALTPWNSRVRLLFCVFFVFVWRALPIHDGACSCLVCCWWFVTIVVACCYGVYSSTTNRGVLGRTLQRFPPPIDAFWAGHERSTTRRKMCTGINSQNVGRRVLSLSTHYL